MMPAKSDFHVRFYHIYRLQNEKEVDNLSYLALQTESTASGMVN